MKVVDDFWLGNIVKKEVEILEKLRNRRHFVQYIETAYIENRGLAIIMEICETSLKDQIEAYKGISQHNVVKLIGGISEAMKFLVRQKLLHRDIKPGNILYSNDCYKLSDFGSSMQVENFEKRINFPDGTREYAHPSIFECMVADDINICPNVKTFLPTCDLWSIGATIFHALMGILPFVPHQGCRNPQSAKVTHEILDQKPRGAIMVYTKSDGRMVYLKELPMLPGLNATLRELLTPLLAALLEVSGIQIVIITRG